MIIVMIIMLRVAPTWTAYKRLSRIVHNTPCPNLDDLYLSLLHIGLRTDLHKIWANTHPEQWTCFLCLPIPTDRYFALCELHSAFATSCLEGNLHTKQVNLDSRPLQWQKPYGELLQRHLIDSLALSLIRQSYVEKLSC